MSVPSSWTKPVTVAFGTVRCRPFMQPGAAHRGGLGRPGIGGADQLGARLPVVEVEDGVPHLAAPVVGGLAEHSDVDHQSPADPALPGQPGVGRSRLRRRRWRRSAAGARPREATPPEVVQRQGRTRPGPGRRRPSPGQLRRSRCSRPDLAVTTAGAGPSSSQALRSLPGTAREPTGAPVAWSTWVTVAHAVAVQVRKSSPELVAANAAGSVTGVRARPTRRGPLPGPAPGAWLYRPEPDWYTTTRPRLKPVSDWEGAGSPVTSASDACCHSTRLAPRLFPAATRKKASRPSVTSVPGSASREITAALAAPDGTTYTVAYSYPLWSVAQSVQTQTVPLSPTATPAEVGLAGDAVSGHRPVWPPVDLL